MGDGNSLLKTTEIRRNDGSWHYFDVDLPEPTYHHCMVAINASQIFLVGGYNDHEYLNTVYLLDKTNICEGWQQKPSLKTKRNGHSCSLVYDSGQNPFVVVAGGLDYLDYLDSSELFDLRTETWSEGPKLPKATSGAKMIGPYHIGGNPNSYTDILKIEKVSSIWQWRHVGNLTYEKYSFDAIEIQLTSE